eukprot:NODE_109_length_18665_cov_0.924486.p19 type:complete len:129 gc:universal NODE_109_length_18665_cov_0.924486:17412-17026(-)
MASSFLILSIDVSALKLNLITSTIFWDLVRFTIFIFANSEFGNTTWALSCLFIIVLYIFNRIIVNISVGLLSNPVPNKILSEMSNGWETKTNITPSTIDFTTGPNRKAKPTIKDVNETKVDCTSTPHI